MVTTFDVEAVRRHFPALNQKQVFFDNAGGSQVLQEVIDRSVASHHHYNHRPSGITHSITH